MKKTNVLFVSLLVAGSLIANPFRSMKPTSLAGTYGDQNNHKVSLMPKKKSSGNWEEGNMLFALGYGFPNLGKTLLKALEDSAVSNYSATGFGPMHFRFEYALSESWGIGLSSNFNRYGWKYEENHTTFDSQGNPTGTKLYNYRVDVTSINFLVRFNKHWAAGSKADIFSGFGLGYSNRSYKYTTDDPNYSNETLKAVIPVGFEWTVGCRIFFTPNIGGYIEAGYAKDILQAGIFYKI